jgi:CRP-like cAMP-binding protein
LELDRTIPRNGVLKGLGAEDFACMRPLLSHVELPLRRQLEGRNRSIEYAYFLESGLASTVVSAGAHQNIEVAIIGNEGMTGTALLMGSDRAALETFIQTAGFAWRISAGDLQRAIKQRPGLHMALLRYVHTLMIQMSFTALANGKYKIEERLARWLLMAADRAEGDAIHLTHEFLAIMLAARRPGVTIALNAFEKRGIVDAARGVIRIRDRGALEDAANGSYGVPEAEYQRLFGIPPA